VRIDPFQMERYQSLYENVVRYNLSESGVRPLRVEELVPNKAGRHALLNATLGYPWGNGSPELRARIAKFYPGAAVDNVTVVNGGSEANYTSFTMLLDKDKGDRAAVQLPNYMQTWGLGRFFGEGADAFWLRHDGNRWALDVDSLNAAVTKQTKVIMVTNPNNPTGAVLTDGEMDAVVRAAKRARAWLVVDEIYRGAELGSRETSPTFWGRYDKLLITSGLSKAFGLPGTRIGWVVGPPKTVEELWAYRDYTTLTPSAMGDFFGSIVMKPKRRDEILARTKGIMRKQWPILEEWLEAHDDILFWTPPDAGAIAYVGYRLPIKPWDLFERLRVERSVLINGADHYGMKDAKYFRIGFGYEADILRTGLDRIGKFLRAVQAGKETA
jgi:aspartate/methionine/tyrosine aminotransferase